MWANESRLADFDQGTSPRRLSLFFALTVGPNLQTTDEQCGQDVLGLIIHPDADAATARGNVSVIGRRNAVLTPVCRVHDKRQERPSREPLFDIACHGQNLAGLTEQGNRSFHRTNVFSIRRSGMSHRIATSTYRPQASHHFTKESGIATA